MGAVMIIVVTPGGQHGPRLRQAREQGLVQTLVPEPGVEALDEPVLLGLAGRDVMPFHVPLFRPAQDRHAGELSAVVADHHERARPALSDRHIQLACHPGARN